MSPEAREKLKEIVRELLKHVQIPESFSDFMAHSIAEYNGETWIIYVDGDKKEGAISMNGSTEYEAKENAWAWFSSIINECKSK